MSSRQIAVLSNPKSTQNLSGFEKFRRAAERHPGVFHFELDAISSVPEALKQFARINPAMLVINGGDGTIHATLTELVNRNPFKTTPPLAILPGGKTNMIAADLGCRGNPRAVLERLVTVCQSGLVAERTVSRHLIEVQCGPDQPKHVGMFFGGAGIVNGILYCRKNIYPLGLPNFLAHGLSIGLLVASALTGARKAGAAMYTEPTRIHLRGGGDLNGRFFFIVGTTLERLILGLKPFGQEGSGRVKFSAVELRAGAVLSAAKGLLTGSFGRKTLSGVNVRRINEFRISGAGSVTLDGEIYEPPPGHDIVVSSDKALNFISLDGAT